MKTGALIIASGDYGEEYRDNEGIPLFLPMYPLDGTPSSRERLPSFAKRESLPL